eukprot:TRINITY_DN7157_c0_g1_i4.p1 TRINITY_DN7157_c0_g1~~TRINITY_DN7157_c0_g1_i4.p1  ORF type:complete len:309 (-),score=42.95 TRINITY_DN7157_c0_g1_i4:145-1071(-)
MMEERVHFSKASFVASSFAFLLWTSILISSAALSHVDERVDFANFCLFCESDIDNLSRDEAIAILKDLSHSMCGDALDHHEDLHLLNRKSQQNTQKPRHDNDSLRDYPISLLRRRRDEMNKQSKASDFMFLTHALHEKSILSSIHSALMTFFLETNGLEWYNQEGWIGSDSCFCNWYGVQCFPCSEQECRAGVCQVEGLYLSDNNLSGDFETATQILSAIEIESLDLSYNSLDGTLPDLMNPTLKYLNVYVNKLTGTIPNFSGIQAIEHIEIDYNQFEGSIPDFDSVPLLRVFWTSSEALSGTVKCKK